MQNFSSTKTYLVRAVYDWCIDNALTPYVAVRVDGRTRVPPQYVRDGQIVLNLAPHATQQMEISNLALSCQARFGGVPQMLYVPLDNIMAIYARENGRGMAFEAGMGCGSAMELGGAMESKIAAEEQPPSEEKNLVADDPDSPDDGGSSAPWGKSGPRLRVVK